MKYFKFLLLLILFSSIAYAQTAADDLADILSNVRSMQADFEQQVLDGRGKIMQKSSGKFALQRPGKFRWETLRPMNQLLIADGKKIWIYDKDLQQVTVQKQTSEDANSPAMLLSGSVPALKNNFKVSYLKTSRSDDKRFLLTPLKKEAMFQSVELHFKQSTLTAMRLLDNLGQASNLKFINTQDNPQLSNHLFQFVKPNDIDVVDQTGK